MIQRFALMILVTHIHGRAGFRWILITAAHHSPGQHWLRACHSISSWTCIFSLAELKCSIDYLNRHKFIILFAVLHSAINKTQSDKLQWMSTRCRCLSISLARPLLSRRRALRKNLPRKFKTMIDRIAMMMNTRMEWFKMLARPRASQSLSDW